MKLTKADIASIDKLVNDAGTLTKINDPFSFKAFEGALQGFFAEGAYDLRCYMSGRSYMHVRAHNRDRFDFVFSRGGGDQNKGWMCTYPGTDNRIYVCREVSQEQLYVVGKSFQGMLFVSKVLFDYRRMQDAQQKKW